MDIVMMKKLLEHFMKKNCKKKKNKSKKTYNRKIN